LPITTVLGENADNEPFTLIVVAVAEHISKLTAISVMFGYMISPLSLVDFVPHVEGNQADPRLS
jgi:hypothetical protein